MVIILFLLFITIFACDTRDNKSVTGAYSYRNPGELTTIMVSPDSLTIETTYKNQIGNSTLTFAGRYENVTAFSVFAFYLKNVSTKDLSSVSLTLNVAKSWKNGPAEFEVFETISDWSDTTRLDPNHFIGELGTPLTTVSDTSTTLTVLNFDIDPGIVTGWTDKKSLLVKNSYSGMAMVSLLSDDTGFPPVLKLIKQTGVNVADTTFVNCSEGTYYVYTGIDEGTPLISESDASGFVLNIGIPGYISSWSAFNKCILKMTVLEHIIPDDIMNIKIYKLTKSFTIIDEVGVDESNAITLTIDPDIATYDIDITSIVNDWYMGGEQKYGLLFKPSESSVSPNQCVFAPRDSLAIIYSTLPEIE